MADTNFSWFGRFLLTLLSSALFADLLNRIHETNGLVVARICKIFNRIFAAMFHRVHQIVGHFH